MHSGASCPSTLYRVPVRQTKEGRGEVGEVGEVDGEGQGKGRKGLYTSPIPPDRPFLGRAL